MNYILVTCSLIDKHPVPWLIKLPESYRLNEYVAGIQAILDLAKSLNNTRIILIENNGPRKTFLDEFGCDVFYTDNNMLQTENKGVKELKDIHACIEHYKIKDDDFIIKLSGRYKVNPGSPFFKELLNLKESTTCMLRYGSFENPSKTMVKDCITGLIGMRCKYVKQIKPPCEKGSVEWKWAEVAMSLPEESVVILDLLGLSMRPMSTVWIYV